MAEKQRNAAEQIPAIMQSLKEAFKAKNNALFSKKKSAEEIYPEIGEHYARCVELMNCNRVHAERNYFPHKLFHDRSPNETATEHKYRKDNYRQITQTIFMDFVGTISRAMHDTNWSIEYGNEAEVYGNENNTFQKYVENDIEIYGSVEQFIKSFLITYKIIDANGVVAVRPESIETIEAEDGTKEISNNLIEPYPYYFASDKVIVCEKDYVLLLSDRKTKVNWGVGVHDVGYVFEYYDENAIYFIEQTGKFTDWQFNVVMYFEHNLGYIPVMRLGGVPFMCGEKIIYQSPFSFAVPNLDIALLNNSNLQIATGKCAFPTPVMYGSVCDFEDEAGHRCNDGKIDIDGHWETCPQCNGSGLKARVNPMGTILLRPPTREEAGDSGMTQAPLSYVAPSSEILRYLEESIDKNIAKAGKILHLRDSDTAAKFNPDTATSSNNDLKATYAFIKPISDQIFNIYQFILNTIGVMRYGENFVAPIIHYPMTFDFKTEDDYLTEINNAVKVGLPPFVLHKILFNYLNTMFFTEQQSVKALNLIVAADRLFAIPADQITLKMARNLIAGWEDILHNSAFLFIKELTTENPAFFEQDIQVQIEQLQQKAKDKEAEIKPKNDVELGIRPNNITKQND